MSLTADVHLFSYFLHDYKYVKLVNFLRQYSNFVAQKFTL